MTFAGNASTDDRFFGCLCGCVLIVRDVAGKTGPVEGEPFYTCIGCADRDSVRAALRYLPSRVHRPYKQLHDATCASIYLHVPMNANLLGTRWQ